MLGAAALRLHWWARHRTERTENATVARLGLEALSTAFAVVEELAGIRGHRFHGLMIAVRTDDRGFQQGSHMPAYSAGAFTMTNLHPHFICDGGGCYTNHIAYFLLRVFR